MKKRFFILLLGGLCALGGCRESKTPRENETGHTAPQASPLRVGTTPANDQPVVPEESDTITTIRFQEFNVEIARLVAWDEEGELKKIQGDTLRIVNEIGETVLGQTIRIANANLTEMEVEQRFETSVSITNEGPHCDLTDWKHFTSEWIACKKLDEVTFLSPSYSEEEQQQFPAMPIDSLKQYVKQECGEEWFQLIKDIQQPNEGASFVGISKVYLRISGTDRITGKRVFKLIVFEEAMGC